MTLDDLEHESGLRPLGEYPDHCVRCARHAKAAARRAACGHECVHEIKNMAGDILVSHCADCGLKLEV